MAAFFLFCTLALAEEKALGRANFTASGPAPSSVAWLVAFTASVERCATCAALEAEIDAADATLRDARSAGAAGARVGFVRADVDPDLAARFGVAHGADLPVIVAFARGGAAVPQKYDGERSAAALVDEAQWLAMASPKRGDGGGSARANQKQRMLGADSVCTPLMGASHTLAAGVDAVEIEASVRGTYRNLSARIWGQRCERALLAVVCASGYPIKESKACHALCELVTECGDGEFDLSPLCAPRGPEGAEEQQTVVTSAPCVTDATVFPQPLPPALDPRGGARIKGWDVEAGFGDGATAAPLAVLMPFVDRHVALLAFNVGLWAKRHVPCAAFGGSGGGPSSPKPDLYPYYNFDLASAAGQRARATLLEALRASDAARCFGAVRFIAADLSAVEDAYDGAGTGSSAGTVNMFYPAVQALALRGHRYMLLMEPDMMPVRARWLDAVQHTVARGGGWWMMGAALRSSVGALYRDYRAQSPTDWLHINGNALYRIGDAHFRAYCAAVARATYPAEFDISLHRFRHSAVHWRTGQTTLARFAYTDLFRNERFFAEAYALADFDVASRAEAGSTPRARVGSIDGHAAAVLVHSTARLDDVETLFAIGAYGPSADAGSAGDSARATLLTLLLKRAAPGDVDAAAATAYELVRRVAARREPPTWRHDDFGCLEWRAAYTSVGPHTSSVDPCLLMGAALVRAGAEATVVAPYVRVAVKTRGAALEEALASDNLGEAVARVLTAAGRAEEARLFVVAAHEVR